MSSSSITANSNANITAAKQSQAATPIVSASSSDKPAQASKLALAKSSKPTGVTNNVSQKSQSQFKLKPFDQIAQQSHPKSDLNLKFFLNSVCFNVNLSDTLLNVYRDINFDSCTLCVCNNNNIYGLDHATYILNDILNASELNQFSSALKHSAHKDEMSGEQKHASSQNLMQTTPNQSMLIGNSSATGNACTCGFSSLVNRSILSKNALSVNLNALLKLVSKLVIYLHSF